MKQLLMEQILTHIEALKSISKSGEPFRSLSNPEIIDYLDKQTISRLEFTNRELRMRRFAYNI